ncbi:hypothetical protein [Pseudomonas indica]|uniref:hypothetical protein n=1 Tax=Pseudomonas indica TaxID=137658 RepID=UPI0009FEA356|nr:hypothetical protein [Pseudomonas indica]
MMRRRSTTPTENFFHLASRLPWWASMLIAAAAWFALQPITNSQPAAITDLHEFSSLVSGQVFCAFAQLGQLLLPSILLIGSVPPLSAALAVYQHHLTRQDPGWVVGSSLNNWLVKPFW